MILAVGKIDIGGKTNTLKCFCDFHYKQNFIHKDNYELILII